MDFSAQLNHILNEEFSEDYRAAVGIVQSGDKWLLGLSRANDDRSKLWVFPGGGIKKGESPEKAVIREVYEETNVRCKVVGKPIQLPSKKGVAFIHCKAISPLRDGLENNHEFAALGWFKLSDMKGLKLYHNVKKLIDRVK